MKWNGRVRVAIGKSEYPALSILAVMGMILLSPFVSAYLCYVAFAICIYRMVRYDAKVFAADYCMMSPVCQFFRTPDGMSLLIWLCLVAAIWYFVRGRIARNSTLVCVLLLLNYLITRMQMNINDFVLCFGQIFVLYVLLPKQDAESAERAIKIFCWSLVVTSLYALIFRNAPQLVAIRGEESIAIWGTDIGRFSGLIRDPNYYMTLLIVGLAALCKLKEIGRMHRLLFWGLGLALTFFGILTYSKTFFLMFILLGGIYIIWQFWDRKVFKGVFFATAAVVAGMYFLFSENSPFAIVMMRLTSGNSLSDLTTGRSDLYVRYWNAITQDVASFLFGFGLNAPLLGKGAHNVYLEIAYYIGVVGLVLMLFFYGSMLRIVKRRTRWGKEQSIIAKYVALLIMAVQYCSLQGMFEIIMYAGVFVAFLSVYITKDNGIVSVESIETTDG